MSRQYEKSPNVSRLRKQSPELINARLKLSPSTSRDRLLQLAEKSAANRHSAQYSPELRPKMGLRAKDKCRNSMFVSEQSLPDKLTQALRHLRPGGLTHSTSSSAPFKSKNKGVVAADDVLYIASPDTKTNSSNGSSIILNNNNNNIKQSNNHYEMQKKRHHSVLMHCSPSQSDLVVQTRDPTLKDLDQIRNLYKSVPNVSTLEDNDFRGRPSRYSHRFVDDFETDMSCSTRSPTDSGYRSTPRHLTEENPYALEDDSHSRPLHSPYSPTINCSDEQPGVSHKTTTVVHVNGESYREKNQQMPILRTHGANLAAFEESLRSFGILAEPSATPINERDVIAVLQGRRCKTLGHFLHISIVPRLVAYITSTMESLTENIKRLSTHNMKVSVEDVSTAVKIVYPLDVYSSCMKAASQASAMFALSGTGGLKKSLSQRAELKLPVGKIYRWLVDKIPTKPISDIVPVCLTAVLECSLEEMVKKLVDNDRVEVMVLTTFEEEMKNHSTMASYFTSKDELSGATIPSTVSMHELIETVGNIRKRILLETEGSTSSAKSKNRCLIKLSRAATRALHYYLCQSSHYRDKPIPIADWTRLIFAFAEHRMSSTVDETDILQTAHTLLEVECPPPSLLFWRQDIGPDLVLEDASVHYAFALMASGNTDNQRQAKILLKDRANSTNQFGLCLVSEAVVQNNVEVLHALIAAGYPVSNKITKTEKKAFLLSDYAGWTPLTWAVGTQNEEVVESLLNARSELQSEQMVKETPLQLAVQLNNNEIISMLLSRGADAFRSSVIYDSTQASFRYTGCPSALALSCVKGDTKLTAILVDRLCHIASTATVNDFLNNDVRKRSDSIGEKTDFQKLPIHTRLALQEAMYYAVETNRPELAYQLKQSVYGLSWNVYTWVRGLQGAAEQKNKTLIDLILADFGPKIASELTEDNIDYCLSVLFSLVKWESRREKGNPVPAAQTLSRLWHYFSEEKGLSITTEVPLPPPHRSLIDSSFVNNEHLSDIRFSVDGEIVFGHRIVLFNASERFKKLLSSPNGIVDITDVSHNIFVSMMEFLYTGRLPQMEVSSLFSLMAAADLYSLPTLQSEIIRSLSVALSPQNLGEVYQFAIVHSIQSLLHNCERFLLAHFGSLVLSIRVRELIISPSGVYDVCSALSSRLATSFDLTVKKS